MEGSSVVVFVQLKPLINPGQFGIHLVTYDVNNDILPDKHHAVYHHYRGVAKCFDFAFLQHSLINKLSILRVMRYG